jgi:hypothetical protein
MRSRRSAENCHPRRRNRRWADDGDGEEQPMSDAGHATKPAGRLGRGSKGLRAASLALAPQRSRRCCQIESMMS